MPAMTFEEILKASPQPTVQYPDRVEYWKKQIQSGNERPVLVASGDHRLVLDGNHTLTAYHQLGKRPKLYEMDDLTFWDESAAYGDKLDYVKQAIRSGKAKPVRKSAILKFNPNHSPVDGKFTSGGGGGASGHKISEYSTGAYDNQVDMRMETKDGDNLAGYMEYSVYDGKPSIQYIHTEDGYGGQGVATKMLQQLQSQYPDQEIDWGMTTQDGTKLREAITYPVKNETVISQKKKLQSMKDELEDNQKELDRLYEKSDNNTLSDAEYEKLDKLGQRWDELYYGIKDMEESLQGQKEVKYMIKMPEDMKKSAMTFDQILKFNPNHSPADGKFTSGPSAGGGGAPAAAPAQSAEEFDPFTALMEMAEEHQTSEEEWLAREAKRKQQMAGSHGSQTRVSPKSQLPEETLKACRNVESESVKRSTEQMTIIDGKGNIVAQKEGQSGEVSFTPGDINRMTNRTVTHNHPQEFGGTFSETDISAFAASGAKAFRAVGKEGTYHLERGEAEHKHVFNFQKEAKAECRNAQMEIAAGNKAIKSDVKAGLITEKEGATRMTKLREDALTDLNHKYEQLADKHGLIYYFEPAGATTKSAMTFDEILKFNPYHGYHGYFSTAEGATSMTFRTKDPSKQRLADNARTKEQARVRAEAIHGVEDKIRNQDFESAALIDKDGNQIFFKDGAKSQVQFTPDEVASMKGSTLTHNHPQGSMFSKEDIGIMVAADLEEIRATTSSGKTFSLSRGEGYTDDAGVAFYNEYAKQFSKAVSKVQDECDALGFSEKINSGKMTADEANREFNKRTTEIMTDWASKNAKEYNLRFAVDEVNVTSKKSLAWR